ncbi:hypothetical protein VNO77_28356 [Canavalia gladiata]|uniref:Terpene synthase 2 n=1 Tax=Canavalia gladiata TaxID=3824 RepID=A0AAN9Q7R3_CANGL
MSSLPPSALVSIQHAESDLSRSCVNFPPNIWGDIFLQYASESTEVNDNMKLQAQILKEEVKKMFQSSTNENITQKLNFIDTVQRLGVSYHFEQEINGVLEQIHNKFLKNNAINEDFDLYFLALLFRLLRQQGYQISSNIFNKFKNDRGNFNEILGNDAEGLCSLYEAAHLRTHRDDILDEALEFTYTHLKTLANQLTPSVAAQINHCLSKPLNKSLLRFEARYHMDLYQQDSSHNKILLTFAKVDFNILQKMYQKEIGNITKWWKKSNFVRKVPYARDRLVESYLWPLASSFKPEYSNGRMFGGKLIAVVCLIDDTYDAYGTIQELELLTKAFQRWDISSIGSLPPCMKVIFDTIVELCEELESMTAESGRSKFVVPHFKKAFCNLIKSYMVEAKWCHEGYIPTYDEYKVNGVLTSVIPFMLPSFISFQDFATEHVFDWIFSNPNIIKAASVIGRVLDDMASHKFEQQRVHVASAVECCMKQYKISKEEAYDLIHREVEDCWKIINEEYLNPNDIPKSVLDCVVNVARMCEFSYENHQDKFTNAELQKDCVSSLLVDPMCI